MLDICISSKHLLNLKSGTHAMKDRTTMRRKVAARMISVLSSFISSDDSDDDDDRASSAGWLPDSYTEDSAALSPEVECSESRTGTHLPH